MHIQDISHNFLGIHALLLPLRFWQSCRAPLYSGLVLSLYLWQTPICIYVGNNMILISISANKQVNFSEKKNCTTPWVSAICSLWKLQLLIYTKLQEKSYYYMFIMYIRKQHRILRQIKFWKCGCAICNLLLCYSFALVLHENVLIFSQSEVHNFFNVHHYKT